MSGPVDARQTVELLVRDTMRGGETLRQRFTDLLQRSDEREFSFLLEAIDQSDYSPSDWVEAMIGFDEWLSRSGEERRPLREITGYIHCCTMTIATGVDLPSLKVIVTEALIEFGFDALSASQI